MASTAARPQSRRLRTSLPLALIMLLGLTLRLLALRQQAVINDDAASFLPLWRGLLQGHPVPGAQAAYSLWPPLYPLLSILLSPLAHGDSELAARFLSLAAGVLILPVIYLIGRQLGEHPVGLLAAFLAAIWPALVTFSTFVYAEMLYALLTTIALWALLMQLGGKGQAWRLALVGVMLGLAYLCRPEAALLAILATAWVFANNEQSTRVRAAATCLLPFLLIGGVYVGTLRAATGAWIMPKATYNLLLELVPVHVRLDPTHVEVLSNPVLDQPVGQFLLTHLPDVLRKYAHNTKLLLRNVLWPLGLGWGWPLGFVGLVWGVTGKRARVAFLAWAAPLLVMPLFLVIVLRLYAWLLAPLMVLVALGVLWVAQRLARRTPLPLVCWTGLLCLPLLTLAAKPLLQPLPDGERAAATATRQAGQWIHEHYGPDRRILCEGETYFYAGAAQLRIPEDPPAAIEDFIQRTHVELVILDSRNTSERPRLAQWFAGQVPSEWQLVHEQPAQDFTIRVYRTSDEVIGRF